MCARAEWTPEQGRGCVSAAPQQCSLWRPLGRARGRLPLAWPRGTLSSPLAAGEGTVQGSGAELYCSPFSPRLQSGERHQTGRAGGAGGSLTNVRKEGGYF